MAEQSLIKKLTAEAFGVTAILLTFHGAAGGASTWASASAALIVPSVSAMVMLSTYALFPISGAHFNPIVTVGCYVSGIMGGKGNKMPALTALYYVLTQLLTTAIVGTLLYFVYEPTFPEGWKTAGISYRYGGEDENANKNKPLWVNMIMHTISAAIVAYTAIAVFASAAAEKTQFHGLVMGMLTLFTTTILAAAGVPLFVSNPLASLATVCSFGWTHVHSLGHLVIAVGMMLVGGALGGLLWTYTSSKSTFAILGAEFWSVFVLGFTVAMAGSPLAGALALATMVYCHANISGGHVNPAVSLAVTAAKAGPIGCWFQKQMYTFMLAQIMGGIAGFFTAYAILNNIADDGKFKWMPIKYEGFPKNKDTMMYFQAFFCELTTTFVLTVTVLYVCVGESTKLRDLFGFAIGAAALAGTFASGLGVGFMNPAIMFGLYISGLVANTKEQKDSVVHWAPWVNLTMQFAGAIMSAMAFRLFYGAPSGKAAAAETTEADDYGATA